MVISIIHLMNKIYLSPQFTKMNRCRTKKVQFKLQDETNTQLIETRQELSLQDRHDRWYQQKELNSMKTEARAIASLVKICGGAESKKGQKMLQIMGVIDLRGLEVTLNDARKVNALLARKIIILYHNTYKDDEIGLSLLSCEETESAKILALEKACEDATEVGEECLQYFARLRGDGIRRNTIQTNRNEDVAPTEDNDSELSEYMRNYYEFRRTNEGGTIAITA